MKSENLVIYRETKPDLGFMREIVLDQALSLFQIAQKVLFKEIGLAVLI